MTWTTASSLPAGQSHCIGSSTSIPIVSAAPRRSISKAQKPLNVATSRQRLPSSESGKGSSFTTLRVSNQPGVRTPGASSIVWYHSRSSARARSVVPAVAVSTARPYHRAPGARAGASDPRWRRQNPGSVDAAATREDDRPRPRETASAEVAIVVVSWNTRDLLARCLDSLKPEVERGRAQVWVVDNASADGSADLVRERFGWVNLIASDENLGFGRAVNLAAERSSSDWIVAANADIAVRPGAVETMLEAGGGDPGPGAIAPPLVTPARRPH